MPTRISVPSDHKAQLVEDLVSSGHCQNAREALREAARIGIADVDAGRFLSFEAPDALSRYLSGIADKVIAGKPEQLLK